jgi:hypothetical protein
MGTHSAHNMEYNSEKSDLIIPEYGRNVQMLIRHAKTIESDEIRQAFIERVIDLMHQMHPQNRNIEDYMSKLWKHVFRIAEYDIEVMPPSGEIPTPETDITIPEPVNYPIANVKYRHYGNNVQILIDKALKMEDGPKKDGFILVIGGYMKMAYKTWNRDHFVSDEIIKSDLHKMSDGRLIIADNISLDGLSNSNRRKRKDDNNDRGRNDRGDRNDRGRNDRSGRNDRGRSDRSRNDRGGRGRR